MSVSLPSKPVFVIDVPEVPSFSRPVFHYNFFTPDETVKKDLEYFYPATFSPWKLQSRIAHLGPKLTCIGTVQPDGEYDLRCCQDNDVNIEIGYFPVEKIRDYYRRAKSKGCFS